MPVPRVTLPTASRCLPFLALGASLLLLPAAGPLSSQSARTASAAMAAPTYGPARGTLIIVGGGNTDGTGIMERFSDVAGGSGAKIVVVPTAGGNFDRDGQPIPYDEEKVLASWRRRGVTNVHMLHTYDPKVADTEAFAAMLADADAVWFNGGRQWNIVDSYAGTRTLAAFHAVLARGGLIGGSSAGASIQGEYLVRGAVSGSNVMMAPEPEHQDAFGFLRRSAIDQHINTRNRWTDLTPILERFPQLLGIGLSEGTAIVVQGDTIEVIGKAKVAIHDNTRTVPAGEPSYFTLSAGDRYDMLARRVLTPVGAP